MVIDILISPDNNGTKMQVMWLIDLINNDSLSYYVKRSSQVFNKYILIVWYNPNRIFL